MSITSTEVQKLAQDPFISSRKSRSSEITKIYKEATSLYVTRRLADALATIQPLVTKVELEEDASQELEKVERSSPIASASRKSRTKVWCFYLTLLNDLTELGPEDGPAAIGNTEWETIVDKVQSGSIWDDVVKLGYGGREGFVDIEVTKNLANLLLAQSPSQKSNQEHIELYLSAAGGSSLDALDQRLREDTGACEIGPANGLGTLKDLEDRVQLLELYALHVLPRNGDWDYAKEFVAGSDILDEETREAFLQTLRSLEQEKFGTQPLRRLDPFQEPDLQAEETLRNSLSFDSTSTIKEHPIFHHKRSGSENDYGIEETVLPLPPVPAGNILQKSTSQLSSAGVKMNTEESKGSSISRNPKQTQSNKHGAGILHVAKVLMSNISRYISKNPLAMLRFILFLMSMVAMFGRQDVKDRLRVAWEKVKKTVGMGVKVTYV